jgi:hypothetical protein
MVEGRSKQAFKQWLSVCDPAWRGGIEVVAINGSTGFQDRYCGGTARRRRGHESLPCRPPRRRRPRPVPAPDPTDHPRPPPPRERSALPGPARTLDTVATCSPTNSSSGSRRCSPTNSHVQVEATWGHLPAHDHRLPADRVQARQPMVRLIDSLSHGVPKPLSELITLGHIEEAGRRRIGLLRPARCQQRTHRGDQWPAPRPPLLGARISQGSPTADHGSRRRLRRRRPRCRRG